MPWPKTRETCYLVCNGFEFRDWLTIQVRHTKNENPPFTARFTCSEGYPLARNISVLQLRPGDHVQVFLAGYPAFSGKIMTRQVFFDAQRHHVELIAGVYPDILTASVIHQTGEFKNRTFEEIAKEVLKPFRIPLIFENPPPTARFPRVNVSPGESVIDFLDTLARSLNLSFTSNENGDFVVLSNGARSKRGSDTVVEGDNLLTGRETIYNQSAVSTAPTIAQPYPSDQDRNLRGKNGFADQNRDLAMNGQRPGVNVLEVPSTPELVKGRAAFEQFTQGSDEITVTVAVQGWTRPSDGSLWQVDQMVIVDSPSLLMNGTPLRAKAVTFTQDNNLGTRTTLTLCNDLAMGKNGVVGGIKSPDAITPYTGVW